MNKSCRVVIAALAEKVEDLTQYIKTRLQENRENQIKEAVYNAHRKIPATARAHADAPLKKAKAPL